MRTALINARIAELEQGRFVVRENAGLAFRDGVIDFIGASAGLERETVDRVIDVKGDLLMPALIDCHTHLVFAGSRAGDFAQRMAGLSYAQIAAQGGGILSTVRQTRLASLAELIDTALPRLHALIAGGVATVEIKSGYGLDLATERRMLQAARALGEQTGARVITTFLPLHALPPEFKDDRAAYVAEVTEHWLPTLAAEGLVDQVDAFVEHLAFSAAEARGFLLAAQRLGLKIKLHAEQLSASGGCALGAQLGALSVDHVEYADEAALAQMAAAGTVAVLLPGAFYALKETRLPPIAGLREHGIPMAVATDLNPGTSPQTSLSAALNQACVLFGLSTEEAVQGATIHAAKALGLASLTRGLCVGAPADVARFALGAPSELCYWLAGVTAKAVYRDGSLLTSSR